MAIVKMKEFTLLTFDRHRDGLLKEFQKFEDVHFKDLQKNGAEDYFIKAHSPEKINRDEGELAKVKFCLTKLEPYASKLTGIKKMTTPLKTLNFDEFDSYVDKYDYNNVYKAVKAADEEITTSVSDISRLKAENDGLRAWLKLDVSVTELERLKYVKYLIGTVNKVAAESFRLNAESKYGSAYIEFLGNIKDDVSMLIMLPAEEYEDAFSYFKSLGFSRMPLNFNGVPAAMISANDREVENLRVSNTNASDKIKGLAGEYDKLHIVHDYFETVLERERACQNFLKTQTTCLIEGWVPDDEAAKFDDILAGVCGSDYYLEQRAVANDSEDVPIKLKNNDMVSAFEDITEMFSMPRYNEIDPTPVLMPFYMLFFGLMLGDAGYGLLLILGCAAALRFFTLTEGGRKFIKFFFYLGFSAIFGGLLYGSFFGFAFFTPIPVGDGTYKAIFDSQADVVSMMILSLALGVVQVITGIAVKGYLLIRDGKVLDAIYDSLFWIITLLSAIGLLLGATGITPAIVTEISKWGFILSILGLIATQGRESPSLIGKIGSGIYSVYGLSSYVGDLVSYTRIAALALSGAYIAFSFNLMAGLMPSGIPRFIFGTLIFIIGQSLNIGLSALGAYVHTCRLQYVEFFGKFYEGGGVPFKAFKLKNKYVNIKK